MGLHRLRRGSRALLATVALSGCVRLAVTGSRPAGAAAGAVAQLHRALDSIVDAPAFRNANWGVLVVSARGDTLYSHNAGKIFMPASNEKLLTTATALTQLGADFRYRTAFVATGPVNNGVLEGDLEIYGRGDPSVSDHMQGDAMKPLRAIADTLAARGIRAIKGGVRAEGNAFPDAVLGYGWSWSDLESGYSAATDELLFNEGFSTVVVRAGNAVGDTVRVETKPAATFPPVRALATTVARGAGGGADSTRRPSVRVVKDTARGDVVVTGALALGDSTVVVVTHRDPAAAFVAAMREALLRGGIDVGETPSFIPSPNPPGSRRGTPVRSPPRVFAAEDTLAILESPPLRDILPALLKPSQNQMAEMLFKTLALQLGRTGTAAEASRVVGAQLALWGAPADGYLVRDGSGLSHYDFVSPETIIHVLDAMRRSADFNLFYESLPIAGVDGTVRSRMRGTAAANNVHAKTGSVAQARSLSGYVTTADGEMLMFSTLANNWTVAASEVERAADSIAVHLATFRRR